jgi:hypothetical protein
MGGKHSSSSPPLQLHLCIVQVVGRTHADTSERTGSLFCCTPHLSSMPNPPPDTDTKVRAAMRHHVSALVGAAMVCSCCFTRAPLITASSRGPPLAPSRNSKSQRTRYPHHGVCHVVLLPSLASCSVCCNLALMCAQPSSSPTRMLLAHLRVHSSLWPWRLRVVLWQLLPGRLSCVAQGRQLV